MQDVKSNFFFFLILLIVYTVSSVLVPGSSFLIGNLQFFCYSAEYTVDQFQTTNSNIDVSKGSTALMTEQFSTTPLIGILLQLFTSTCVALTPMCDILVYMYSILFDDNNKRRALRFIFYLRQALTCSQQSDLTRNTQKT